MAFYARFALLLALPALVIQPAGAQTFLESLFGSDGPSPSRPASGYVRSQPTPPLFEDLFGSSDHDTPLPHVRDTTYRTLCVRMCDGFYFPISHATTINQFAHDAEKCMASCAGARLFYYPNPGRDVAGMLDLTGRAYASYATAFKYRKTLVQGCQCRPQPWTEAERARHRAYAAAQAPGGEVAQEAARATVAPWAQSEALAVPPAIDRSAFAPFAPGMSASFQAFNRPFRTSDFSAQDDPGAVARPMPVYRQSPTGQWEWFVDTAPAGQARSRYNPPGMR